MTASRITNAILVSCLLCAGAPATASTYIESLDAGDLIGTALAVGPGVSSIQGQVASSRTTDVVDIDVYRLELPAGAFSAAVTASIGTLDTALVLFDGTGKGLRADDDSGDADTCLYCGRVTETLATAGTYYLAVFDVGDVDGPFSTDGLIWDEFVSGLENAPPNGDGKELPWTGWQLFEGAGYPLYVAGSYAIDLSVATVPLPGALPLLACALAGLVLLAPKRRGGRAAMEGRIIRRLRG